MLIPPSNSLIVYATVAGSVSISALFMAGYVPGILWGLGVMLVAGFIAKRRGYVSDRTANKGQTLRILFDAIPSLMMIVVVIGGILGGSLLQRKPQPLRWFILWFSALFIVISKQKIYRRSSWQRPK